MEILTNACGVIVECEEEILILKRRESNYQGNKWDVPGGRLKFSEPLICAAKRELFEETGFLCNEDLLEFVKEFKWIFNDEIISFKTLRLKIPQKFEVKLNPLEHINYKWVSPQKCYNLTNLIHGFYDILEEMYSIDKSKKALRYSNNKKLNNLEKNDIQILNKL